MGDKQPKMPTECLQLDSGKRDAAWTELRLIISDPKTKPKMILIQEPPLNKLLPAGKNFKHQGKGKVRALIFMDDDFADHVKAHLLTSFTNSDQVAVNAELDNINGGKIKLVICSLYSKTCTCSKT